MTKEHIASIRRRIAWRDDEADAAVSASDVRQLIAAAEALHHIYEADGDYSQQLRAENERLREENEAWNSALEQFGIEPERVLAYIQNLQAECSVPRQSQASTPTANE